MHENLQPIAPKVGEMLQSSKTGGPPATRLSLDPDKRNKTNNTNIDPLPPEVYSRSRQNSWPQHQQQNSLTSTAATKFPDLDGSDKIPACNSNDKTRARNSNDKTPVRDSDDKTPALSIIRKCGPQRSSYRCTAI
jgi:hypothetical protein